MKDPVFVSSPLDSSVASLLRNDFFVFRKYVFAYFKERFAAKIRCFVFISSKWFIKYFGGLNHISHIRTHKKGEINSTGFECSRGVDTLIRSETSLEKGITKSEFGN